MQMTFRWYGKGNDCIPLKHIKQIPGVSGVVWSLHDMPAGEYWPMERIEEVKAQAAEYGLNIDVVESVNVHEDIKLGLPTREKYIENYKNTLKNLGKAGVKVVCYNFMPVFDWTRTDLFKALPDGSTALFYEKAKIDGIDPIKFMDQMSKQEGLGTMPGWEPERLAKLKELFVLYKDMTEEKLWDNLKYFLEAIIPVAEEAGIKMAIHPDDPPWNIFGLPRIITSKENLGKFLKLVDSPANGLTLCSGSLGASEKNNIPDIVRTYGDRIYFAHIRNVKRFENGDFTEVSHRGCDGSLDIVEIVKAYHDIGYKYYVRPDHGRHIWDEKCRPGYGLYDRALGIMYMWGVWDTLEKNY
ncbi:mannonate dehydratase [Elusimicrobium simillimum]|uniref:mannonate dehydratase n=1 Tax=Elusimicrobium simillimum TaxID=3143438 RepID=UPI003C6F9A19